MPNNVPLRVLGRGDRTRPISLAALGVFSGRACDSRVSFCVLMVVNILRGKPQMSWVSNRSLQRSFARRKC